MPKSAAVMKSEMDAAEAEIFTAPRAYVCNLLPITHVKPRSYGPVTILPCPEDKPYEVTELTARRTAYNIGIGDTKYELVKALDIAKDVVKEINGNLWVPSDATVEGFSGVFVCAGPVPTQKEVSDAEGKLGSFYDDQIRMANQMWESPQERMSINAVHRRAAKARNLDPPWLYSVKPTAECPVCAEIIKPGVAVCKSCGAILDRAKAAQFGLIEAPAPASQKKA